MFPSTIEIKKKSIIDSPVVIRTLNITKQYQPASATIHGAFRQNTSGGRLEAIRFARGASASIVQKYSIRQNEVLALYMKATTVCVPLRVEGTIRLVNANRTFTFAHFVNALGQNSCLFSIKNTDPTEVVELVEYGVSEVGSFDTAYLQLVPIGGVVAAALDNPHYQVNSIKMDSLNPDANTWVKIVRDCPLNPFGVPQNYIAEGSASATPKGFNYLGTKDFIGPVYRTLFPEYTNYSTNRSDSLMLGANHKSSDLFARRAGITLREGEGIALSSAAESATVSSAVGSSGWGCFEIAINFDIENASQPYLNLNNVVSGSDIIVLEVGTSNEYTSQDDLGSTSFSWAYDQDTVPSADVVIYKEGYVPYILRNVPLGAIGATIPVAQVVDRNYSNP